MSILGAVLRLLGLKGDSSDADSRAMQEDEQLLDTIRQHEELEQPHHHDEDCDY